MTKFSRKAADEVPDRDSDNARRKTKPANVGPASPREIDRLYSKGKEHPDLAQGDKRDMQTPQSPVDQRQKDYDNDTARGWLRGEGEDGRGHGFDHGKFDKNDVPLKPTGPRNTASGKDMTKSPFSKAHRTYSED